MPKRFHAVLWDMDGTLIDSEPWHAVSVAYTMENEGLCVPDDLATHVTGCSSEAVHAWLRREYNLSCPFDKWIKARYKRYADNIAHVKPVRRAVSLWHSLARRGVKQAVVSSSDRLIVQVNMSRCGILDPRVVSVSSNDVLRCKPSPEPYLRGAYLLDVDPGACVVLET